MTTFDSHATLIAELTDARDRGNRLTRELFALRDVAELADTLLGLYQGSEEWDNTSRNLRRSINNTKKMRTG